MNHQDYVSVKGFILKNAQIITGTFPLISDLNEFHELTSYESIYYHTCI